MKWEALLRSVADLPYFEIETLKTLFPDTAHALHVGLSRWKKTGKVLELRRGLYTLAEPWRRAPLHAPGVAYAMYPPSYLSLEWALSWYGIIPERSVTLTSVGTRATRTFSNSLGRFSYRTVKPSLFWGYRTESMKGLDVYLAEPEKALCDLWYLSSGDWTPERMLSHRFDPLAATECIEDPTRLEQAVGRFASPRMYAALQAWHDYTGALG